MQGNLQAENESITWKSYMWDLPHGVLKFAVNSSIDMLPTFTNLKVGEVCFGQLPALWEHGEAEAVPFSHPL
jgi:hypothetical protein